MWEQFANGPFGRRRGEEVDFNFYERPSWSAPPMERDTGFPQVQEQVGQLWHSLPLPTRQPGSTQGASDQGDYTPSRGIGSNSGPLGQEVDTALGMMRSVQGHEWPSTRDILGGLAGAGLGQLGASGALPMGGLLYSGFTGGKPDGYNLGQAIFGIAGGPLGGLSIPGGILARSDWAQSNPMQAFGGGIPGANYADEMYRLGATPDEMQNIINQITKAERDNTLSFKQTDVRELAESIMNSYKSANEAKNEEWRTRDLMANPPGPPTPRPSNDQQSQIDTFSNDAYLPENGGMGIISSNGGSSTYGDITNLGTNDYNGGAPVITSNSDDGFYAGTITGEDGSYTINGESVDSGGGFFDSIANEISSWFAKGGPIKQRGPLSTLRYADGGKVRKSDREASKEWLDMLLSLPKGSDRRKEILRGVTPEDMWKSIKFNKDGTIKEEQRFTPDEYSRMLMRNALSWGHYGGTKAKDLEGMTSELDNQARLILSDDDDGQIEGYARGGRIKRYADGGQVSAAENVLMQIALHQYNPRGIARALKQTGGGQVRGPGGGLDDAVPAMIEGQQPAALSNDEYVMDAETVSALGDGSSSQGHKILDALRKMIRQQKYGRDTQSPRMKMGLSSLLNNASKSI